jgi:hypothetical protein
VTRNQWLGLLLAVVVILATLVLIVVGASRA